MLWTSQVAQWWRLNLPTQETQEMRVQHLSQEDPLEQEVATHSSILAWEASWTEEPGRLESDTRSWVDTLYTVHVCDTYILHWRWM